MENLTVGFALCGSYCTFSRVIPVIETLCSIYSKVVPIMSGNAYITDTRFGKAADHVGRIEKICDEKMLYTAVEVEPIGPKGLLDLLIVAPCTGNTLAKIAYGISDTSVTGAVKSQLRNGRPVLIAVSTNDALGANAKNIGALLNTKNIFFVPMTQDSPEKKPTSIVARMESIPQAAEAALGGKQLMPVFY